jgi:thiol-disulfide isomerase/thioredoxin
VPPAAFGAPPGFGAPMPQTDGRAGIALVLGILSMTCAGFVAGIPAVILGLMAKRDIDRSGGTKTGTGLALGGVVTGVMGTLVSAAISLLVIAGIVSGASEAGNAPHGSPHASPEDERTDLIPEPDHAQNPAHKGKGGKSGTAVPVAPGAKMVGTVQVVTLDPDDDRDLEDQLDAAAATAQGRQLVVQTSASWCGPCKEFDTSLSDPRMQRALGRVTIVKVDVDAFKDDLRAMNIVTKSVPWFYKMDSELRPVDAISAGEWDANIPANMAPVFEAFLAGRLTKRREPSPLRGPQL